VVGENLNKQIIITTYLLHQKWNVVVSR